MSLQGISSETGSLNLVHMEKSAIKKIGIGGSASYALIAYEKA